MGSSKQHISQKTLDGHFEALTVTFALTASPYLLPTVALKLAHAPIDSLTSKPSQSLNDKPIFVSLNIRKPALTTE